MTIPIRKRRETLTRASESRVSPYYNMMYRTTAAAAAGVSSLFVTPVARTRPDNDLESKDLLYYCCINLSLVFIISCNKFRQKLNTWAKGYCCVVQQYIPSLVYILFSSPPPFNLLLYYVLIKY